MIVRRRRFLVCGRFGVSVSLSDGRTCSADTDAERLESSTIGVWRRDRVTRTCREQPDCTGHSKIGAVPARRDRPRFGAPAAFLCVIPTNAGRAGIE
jgi:hypothetical protein